MVGEEPDALAETSASMISFEISLRQGFDLMARTVARYLNGEFDQLHKLSVYTDEVQPTFQPEIG